MNSPKTVDDYIHDAPKEIQKKLKELRSAIKSTAPQAEEKISYGMPYYGYKGRLVYFAAFKHHIGVYIAPPIIAEHAEKLMGYKTAMATVQFPHDKKLPIPLIKSLIRARMKKNEMKK